MGRDHKFIILKHNPMILLFHILIFSFILLSAYLDYVTIVVDKITIDSRGHRHRLIFRIFIATFISGCFINQHQPDWSTLYELAIYVFYVSSWFWLVFDISLNFARKLPILYVGKNGFLDVLFRNEEGLYLLIKLLSLIASGYMYYNLIR